MTRNSASCFCSASPIISRVDRLSRCERHAAGVEKTIRYHPHGSYEPRLTVFGQRYNMAPGSAHQFKGGSPFTISGVPLAQDVAVLEAGLDAAISDAVSVGISYSGQQGSGISDHGLRGNLSWRF